MTTRLAFLLVLLASGVMCNAADSGPSDFFSLRSPSGYGPFLRGAKPTLTIEVGNRTSAQCSVYVHVESDSGEFRHRLSLLGKEKKSVEIDLRRIQYSDRAILKVEYGTPGYYGENSTAERDLSFAWEHIGVRLDSASSVPFEIGTGKPIQLEFTPPIAMPRLDSFIVSLLSADRTQRIVKYTSTTLPQSFQFSAADVAQLKLGAMASVAVVYGDNAHTRYEIDVRLPIDPHPISMAAVPSLQGFRTNNYGAYRTPQTPGVPASTSTIVMDRLPEQTEKIVFAMVFSDGTTLAIDSIVAPKNSILPSLIEKTIERSNLDVRTTFLRASVYVRWIATPFDVELPTELAPQRATATVTAVQGGAGRLILREWNPRNTSTSTISPDTTQVVTLAWPIGRIDSLELRFYSSHGLTLRRSKFLPNKDRHTCAVTLEPELLPPSTARMAVRAFIDGVADNVATWDTSIVMTPSLPSLTFQRQAEYTSIGAIDVSDVFTIADLPPEVDSVRLMLRDADTAVNYVDTILVHEAAPYLGDILFASPSTLSIPLNHDGDDVRSIGFFVRSGSPKPFRILRLEGGFPNIELQSDSAGQLRLASGTDTLESSYVIKTHEWHYVCIIRRLSALHLYVNGGYQGQLNVPGLTAAFTNTDRGVFGNNGQDGDSLFAVTSITMWANELDVRDVQIAQISEQPQINALRHLPLSSADTNGSQDLVVRDQKTGEQFTISKATLENIGQSSSYRVPLLDIGMWRYWSSARTKRAIPVDAYLTYFMGVDRRQDTVRGLIQLQSITGALDSASCSTIGLPKSTISSSQGWGPFNTLAPYGSTITYHAGYTWQQAEANAGANKDGFSVTFSLLNSEGRTTDSVTVNYRRSDVRDSAASRGNEEIVVSTPRPLRMDLITDSTFVVLVENSAVMNGWNSECLDIQARIAYTEPPPVPVLASSMGPFRQSKIPTGERLWNTFTAFTVNGVEDSLDFVVQNNAGAVIRIVHGKQVARGIWKADIDMASCMPPVAMIHAQSYERGNKKRTSQPIHFTIIANRPVWMTRGSNIRWYDLTRNGSDIRATAMVDLGPVFRNPLTKRIPLLSGIELMVLPMSFRARLAWNSTTNELRVIKDSSSVKIWYTSDADDIDVINSFVGDISNFVSVLGNVIENLKAMNTETPTKSDLVDPVVDGCQPDPIIVEPTAPSDPAIPNMNWDLTNTESSSFTLDSAGNLTVRSTFLEGGILQLFPEGAGIQATVNVVIDWAEDDVEEFTAGIVNLNVLPVFQGAFELIIRSYLGTDRNGTWGPRGALPTQLAQADTTSMVGSGLSIGLGVALQLNVLQGAVTVTCALTGNVVQAEAIGYTQLANGVLDAAFLASLGFSVDAVIFSQELWGLTEQYLYGPTSIWKARLAGDNLTELYPLTSEKIGAPQESAQSNDEAVIGRYQSAIYLPPASPSPRSARYGDHTAIAWVDQDHLTGVGTLQLGIHRPGEDTLVSVQRIVKNARSIVSPELCALSDSTILVTWKEVDVERTSFTSSTSRLIAHATSDIQWAVVNTNSGSVVSLGEIATDSATSSSIRELMVDGKPHVSRVTDSSAMIVWVSADTVGGQSAVYSSLLHGSNGVFTSDDVIVVERNTKSHRTPRVVSREEGVVHCSWITSDTAASVLHASTFRAGSWSTPRVVDLPDVAIEHIDVDETGAVLLVTGVTAMNGRQREMLTVLRADAAGQWDATTRRDLQVGHGVSMIYHPRVTVRGDSACIMFRSSETTSGKIGQPVHRLTTVVVDLRSGAYGYGVWTPTDSLSLVNDLDITWEPGGVNVVVQEHLPFAGLHANGSLQRPFGLPQMNLGLHMIDLQGVITGIRPDDHERQEPRNTSIMLMPTPAWSTVTVHTDTPFRSITVMSLGGSVVSTPYTGEPTRAAAIDVHTLTSGTYILSVDTPEGLPLVTLLRIGGR